MWPRRSSCWVRRFRNVTERGTLMRNRYAGAVLAGLVIVTTATFGQGPAGKVTFDVASVRPSPPPDMQKMMADLQMGKKPEWVRIDGSRVTFNYMSLKELIGYAYKMRAYEISGPDWMVTDRFDIAARLPEGTSTDDVPAMLQALLKERFGLTTHREAIDQPVFALVARKAGPKLQEATVKPEPLNVDLWGVGNESWGCGGNLVPEEYAA